MCMKQLITEVDFSLFSNLLSRYIVAHLETLHFRYEIFRFFYENTDPAN